MPRRGRSRLHRAAHDAAAAGLFVFPVWPGGKTPAVANWETVATRDRETIAGWWAQRPYNIGLAVGRSRIVVIDLDQPHGHTAPHQWVGARGGRDVMARLAAAAGEIDPIATYTVTTATGGEHRYFRMPTGLELRNTQGSLGWKIDTRGHGGYVVGAGSVRNGVRYRRSRAGRIAELPAWLADALTPAPAPAPAAGLQLTGQRMTRYVHAALTAAAEQVRAAAPGQRHRTRLYAAIGLGTLVGAGVLDEDLARHTLVEAAAGHLDRDDPSRKIRRDIDDGLAYGRARPRALTQPERKPGVSSG